MVEICERCYMPNTRPNTIFEGGVCQACKNFDTRKNVNWGERIDEFRKILEPHKSKDGSWDCMIPVSGGKDSHALVYWIKEVMGMNPLLVTVNDPFTVTKAGLKNQNNVGAAFDCDHIFVTVNENLLRKLIRNCFEEFLDPLRFLEQIFNVIPFKVAMQYNLRLTFKAEDSGFMYGGSKVERKSAIEKLLHNINDFDLQFWLKRGATMKELNFVVPPTQEEFEKLKPESYFLSYFVPWSSVSNLKIAKKYGFVDLTHEWHREGCIEHFEQIDSMAYLVHLWLKYPKFGFQRTSDIVSRRIREGRLSKEEGRKLIEKYDPVLDQLALKDFIDFLGYTPKQFWDIVDKFWNPEIFEKEKDMVSWRMKSPRFPEQKKVIM